MIQHSPFLNAKERLFHLLAQRIGAGTLKRLVMVGLVLLTLVAAYWLGPRASTRYLMLLVAAIGGVLLLRRPQWGLVLLIPVSLLVPIAIGTGTQTEVPISLLFLAGLLAIWLADMVRRRALRLVPSPANVPLVALIVVAGLALVAGQSYWNPLVTTKSNFLLVQMAQWAVFILSAGAFWLTANLLHDTRWLRWMVVLFLTLGAIHVTTQLLLGRSSIGRLFVAGSTGSLFWVWIAALAGGQVLFNRRLPWYSRVALIGLVVAAFSATWFLRRGWVSGWAPPLAVLVILLWLRSARWGALTTAGLVLGMYTNYSYFYENVVLYAMQTGSFLRLDAWQGIMRLVGNHWLLGLGPAAYYHYWSVLIGNWAWTMTNVTYNPQVNSHNNYVDIYAQMGVLGLAAFLWAAVAIWRQGWQVRKTVPDGFERGYVYGCLGGLAGSLAAGFLGDWFTPFVYNIGLAGMRTSILGWLFLGGLVSLSQLGQAGQLQRK